jgi:hypothetical protein
MSTQIQTRRGTTTQHSSFTGAAGELTVDTDKNVVVVHDGSTAGGHPMASPGAANTFTAEQTFSAGLSVDGAYEQVAEAVGALDIDLSTGNYFTKSISTSSTITFSNPPASGTVGSFTLELALSGASTAITWPASVYWNDDAGQVAPTLTDARTHLFVFITSDGGTTYRGAVLKNYTA